MANLTRNTHPTNLLKNYRKVIGQEGMIGIDAEWNELQDILRDSQQRFLETIFNKIRNTGVHIQSNSADPTNNFKISVGSIFVPEIGMVEVHVEDTYKEQDDWTASHTGGPTTNPGALTTPSGARTDLVYAEVFITEITSQPGVANSDGFFGDDYLNDPVYGQENSIREKIVIYYRVAENTTTLPAPPAGHQHVALAYLHRTATANITDDMIEIIFDKRLPQDLFRHLKISNYAFQNCIIGSNASLVPSIPVDDTPTITDIASDEFLYIDGKLIPSGNLNNTTVLMDSGYAAGYYNLIVKLQSSDMTLNFIVKLISDGVASDEFVVGRTYWSGTGAGGNHNHKASYGEFLGYGDGIRTVFEFPETTEDTSYTVVYKDGTPESPTITTASATFSSAPAVGELITADFAYGGEDSVLDKRVYELINSVVADVVIQERNLKNNIIRPAHVNTSYVLPPGVVGLILDEGVSTPDGFTEKKITVWDNAGTLKGQIKIEGVQITNDELRFAIRT